MTRARLIQSQVPPDPQLPPRAPQNLSHPFQTSPSSPLPTPRRRFISLSSPLLFHLLVLVFPLHPVAAFHSFKAHDPRSLVIFDSQLHQPIRSLPPFDIEFRASPTLDSITQQLLRPAFSKSIPIFQDFPTHLHSLQHDWLKAQQALRPCQYRFTNTRYDRSIEIYRSCLPSLPLPRWTPCRPLLQERSKQHPPTPPSPAHPMPIPHRTQVLLAVHRARAPSLNSRRTRKDREQPKTN